MTKVYFVRHAEPNYENHDDLTRELTEKGLRDREKVTAFLEDKDIDVVLSSPFKRAYDTVKHFADSRGENIQVVEDFKERKIDNIRWAELSELSTFDYFDLNAVIAYLVKVNMVARWAQLDKKVGREMFDRLVAELDGKEMINKL